jgi:hypothetical protein
MTAWYEEMEKRLIDPQRRETTEEKPPAADTPPCPYLRKPTPVTLRL